MKKIRKIQTKETSEFWETKKDEIFTIKKIYFSNGEQHVKAFNENRTIDLPYTFFNDLA